MTDLDNFVESNLGVEALKLLNYQSVGGNNNSKGNMHEQFFAVYKLAKYYSEQPEDKVQIMSQDKAFVDDLIIINVNSGVKRSYQLKDSKRVYWSKRKGISQYFKRQYAIDKDFHNFTDAKTILVLAQESVFNLRKKDIPKSIQPHTECILFKNSNTVNRMLLDNPRFKSAISNICINPNEIDKMEVIVQSLLGAWNAYKSELKEVSSFFDKAKVAIKPDFFKDNTNVILDGKLIAILDNIDEIKYTLESGYLRYRYRSFEGIVRVKVNSPQFDTIKDEILHKNPSDAMSLFSILMKAGN